MKRLKRAVLKWILAGAVAGIPSFMFAGFVSETGRELLTAADLDGNALLDVVVLDKESGTFRAGYQAGGGTFSWSASRAAGATNITDMATGYVLSTNREALAVTTPLLNRVNLIDASSPAQPSYPVAANGSGRGAYGLAATEIGGTTDYEDLFTSTSLNSYGSGLDFIRSSGDSFTSTKLYNTTELWERCNTVEYDTGMLAVGTISGGDLLRLDAVSSNILVNVTAKHLSGMTAADYAVFYPAGTGFVHVVAWESGSALLRHFEMVAGYVFSTTTVYDFGTPVSEVYVVEADGIDRLAVVFESGNAVLYDFDGTAAPAVLQDLGAAPENEVFSGVVQVGADEFLLLRGDAASGITVSAERFVFNGIDFDGGGAVELPAMSAGRGRGNAMVFENEPFVSGMPRQLQALNAGDWTDEVVLVGPVPSDIEADYEVDRGLPDGLGSRSTITLGKADPVAGYTLANQPHTAFSVFNFEAAVGELVDEAVIFPDPGHYRTGVAAGFTNATGAGVYYRIEGSSLNWVLYSSPFSLFADSTVYFYTYSGGAKSRIQTATYTFEYDPSSLDSDGDGIPDYVEIANGLDPIDSGIDADGDGFSDLEELLAGSDPAGTSSVPSSVIGIEQGSVYDQVLTPRPYDGVDDVTRKSQTDTQLRLYSASGSQQGFAKTTNLVLSVAVTNPAAFFAAVPLSDELPFVTAITDVRFDVVPGSADNQRGVELIGMYPRPDSASTQVGYSYQGGDLATEASNWLASARSVYTNETRTLQVADLGIHDTLSGLLVERKLVDLLIERGMSTNRLTTLFPGRMSDAALPAVSQDDLMTLQSPAVGVESYRVMTVLSEVNDAVATHAALTNLRTLATGFYDVCSELGPATPGAYELPVDALRNFLIDGSAASNYTAALSMSPAQLADAFNSATQLLASVSSRPVGVFDLAVRSDSFDGACPVLYTGGGTPKSLYDENGNAYLLPTSFLLPVGSVLRTTAFTDVDWNDCPGTDPLEVIELSVTAVPTASGHDLDGNLLPDAFEDLLLGGGGGFANEDSDGDGFSDLQEYLEQTDPSDDLDFPAVAVADMSPPWVYISTPAVDQVRLDIDWPAAYVDPFIFTIMQTTNLPSAGFMESYELPKGSLSESVDASADDAAFYRVQMQLR